MIVIIFMNVDFGSLGYFLLRYITVNRKFPVNSNGRMERLRCNFHYLEYYCSSNLSIHQNRTQEPTWNFLVTLSFSQIFCLFTKGQIKPKADWRAVYPPKKRTNEFLFVCLWQTKQIHSFGFWEDLRRANLLSVLSDL